MSEIVLSNQYGFRAVLQWRVFSSTWSVCGSGIMTGRGYTTAVSVPGAVSPLKDRLYKQTNFSNMTTMCPSVSICILFDNQRRLLLARYTII